MGDNVHEQFIDNIHTFLFGGSQELNPAIKGEITIIGSAV